jgi:glutamate carboxypeptidase
MPSLEAAIAALHARVPEMIRLTRCWVEQNSYSGNLSGLNAMADLLAAAFRMPGLELRREPGGAGSGDHLFWSSTAAASAAPVLLIGHHDTVFPPGHFEGWREQGTRAQGPGCLDMKGGLAVIWGVLSTLSGAGLLDRLPLVAISVADEEVSSLDSRPHLEAWARRAECALVFESGRAGDRIVTSRRGVGGVRAIATGKAAHAGNAHREGANAIWALARFIDMAQAQTDYARGVTVNAGIISGGTASNTVAERAEATFDLRFDTEADAEALIEALQRAARDGALPGTQLQLEGGVRRLPMAKTAASEALYRAYAACQRAAGLGDGEHPLVGGGSDGNTVAGVGLPVIDGLGPRGQGVHTTNETVELDSFGPKAEALLRFLWSKLG